MQVQTRQVFMKPRKRVLARFRNVERIEAVLSSNGLTVERRAEWPEPAWQCAVMWNESPRLFDVLMAEPETGSRMQAERD